MGIDFYINNITDDKLLGKGFRNKCYDFGNVVLLQSRYLSSNEFESCLEEVSGVKDILDRIDVNSYKIIDFKILNDRLYVLESKVKGVSLQDTGVSINSSLFINRLRELDNYVILKKFVSDYLTLVDNGIYIDPGTPNNFLFDGNCVGFIDLGLSCDTFDKKYICFNILRNIMYTYCIINDSSEVDIISFYIDSIYNKLCSIYMELGFDSTMYSFSPNGLICDYIERKINCFRNDYVFSRTKSI